MEPTSTPTAPAPSAAPQKSKLSPLQRQQTAPAAFLPFAPHTKSNTSTSLPPRASPPSRGSSSTIYHRHEARRAKTLENANDDRPALVRVLAQLQTSAGVSSHSNGGTLDLGQPHQLPQQPQVIPDNNIFSSHPSSNKVASSVPLQHTTTCTVAALASAFSAAVGARLVDFIFLSQQQNTNSKAARALSSAWPVEATSSALKVRYNSEGSLSLWHPQQQTQTKATSRLLASSRSLLPSASATSRWCWSSPSLAPMVLLFGTQAWMEQHLLLGAETALDAPHHLKNRNSHHQDMLSVASVAASGAAGAVFGLYQTVRTGLGGYMGVEAGAAILYFGTYRLLKGALTGSNDNNAKQHSGLGRSDPVLCTALAGATAGCVYELTRLFGGSGAKHTPRLLLACPPCSSPFATSAAPISLRPILMRAAPAHAVLFLGYEATHSMLQLQGDGSL